MRSKLLLIATLGLSIGYSRAQNEIYINDVYFDRFFRKVIVEAPPADKGSTDLADIYGQRNKTGIEGYILEKKHPGFAVIAEQKWKKRFNWNYGYMLYRRPFDSLPGSEMVGHLVSGGVSLYTKYIKIYTGAVFRYGYNPEWVVTADSSYWKKAGATGISPFLYFDFPFKKFVLSGNAVPTADFSDISRASLKFGFRLGPVKQEMYADRMKAIYGMDYDGGYDLRYIFKDPMKGNSDGYYAKLRLGKSFIVDETKGQTFNSQISNNENTYVQIESAFWYVLGFNWHKQEGFGWRAGLDFKVERYRIALTYQDKYVMSSSFGNRPDKGMWWMSIIIN